MTFLKYADPFKLYRYAKPGKAIERDMFVMPVGEKYNQHSMYFIEILPTDYIQVQAYGNRIQLIEADEEARDIDFEYRLVKSIFDRAIGGIRKEPRDIRIYSNAAIEFLTRGGFI